MTAASRRQCWRRRNLDKRFGGIVAASAISIAHPQGRPATPIVTPTGAGKNHLRQPASPACCAAPRVAKSCIDGRVDHEHSIPHRRVRLGIAPPSETTSLFADLNLRSKHSRPCRLRAPRLRRDWWRIVGSRAGITAEVAELLERFRLVDVMTERTAILPYAAAAP